MKKIVIIFLSLVCLCFVTGCPSDKTSKTTTTIADDTMALPVITAEATESPESIKPSANTPTPMITSNATNSKPVGTTADMATQAPTMPSETVKDVTKETTKETTRETTTQPTTSSPAKETVPAVPTPTPVPKATPIPAPTVTPIPVPTATPVPEPTALTGSYDTAMAQTVAGIVNTERTNAGVSTLTWDSSLAGYAQIRAAELAISFSHTRPDGSAWYTAGTGICGENIASGQISAEEVMTAWMNSSGHKENILRPQYTLIGVGCYQIDGAYYWVQLFG